MDITKINQLLLYPIIFFLVSSSCFVLFSFTFYEAEGYINSPDAQSESRQIPWELTQQIDKTITVTKGKDHYFYLDAPSGVIREKSMPAPEAGLNKTAVDAAGLVPKWLRDDLALKLRDTASVPIVSHYGRIAPAFADIDNDDDLDLINGDGFQGLVFFENKGTKHFPIFVEISGYFDKINILADQLIGRFYEVAPTAADVDGDFDVDILAGHQDGSVLFFENNGTPAQPNFEGAVVIEGMAVSGNSAPNLVDYDGDSDLDVVVGDGGGRIHLFTNSGTGSDPQWFRDITNPLSEVQVNQDASPFLSDMDNDGDLDITIGDSTSIMSYYRCATSGLTKNYVLDETMYFGITLDTYNHPAPVDIDGDGLPEFLVGSQVEDRPHGQIYFYENFGNIANPEWNLWSSYKAVPGITYYPPVEFLHSLDLSFTDKLALVISNAYKANPLWVDEVAFAMANTAAELLRNMDETQVRIFVDNAKYLYDIDPYLEYATIKEVNKGTEDYYSTVEYKTLENGFAYTREFPRDIYYWYIVHTKITEETPGYVDPNSGNLISPTQNGRFWREYLFFHHDTAYPPDTSGSPTDGIDDYPTTYGPPLLKDLLKGVKYLWNGTRFTAPGGRPVNYGDNAVIRISNWVGKTLILNQQEVSDDERPTQPVRIAHHHNGNCGELQDLTAAAARTALIPAAGINLVAEDHVWNEFYENGWRHWDNHWSDSGSHINKFDMYWVGWRERGGSGIWSHQGNDDTFDVTHRYVPGDQISRVIVKVNDRQGNPVDGARVLFGSHWMAERNIEQVEVTFPFPGIWNYTDINGESEFHLAKQNFTIKVLSKLGNAVQEKTYVGAGGVYYFNFTLEGVMPRPSLPAVPGQVDTSVEPSFKVQMEFNVINGVQHPPNPESGLYHPEVQTRSNTIDFFVTDESGFTEYQTGFGFSVINLAEDVSSYSTTEFEFDAVTNWYFVIANLDSLETAKNIKVKIKFYQPKKDEPSIIITSPLNNTVVFVNDQIEIKGNAYDEDGINSVLLRIINLQTNEIELQSQLPLAGDDSWIYEWNTRRFEPGTYIVEAEAKDNKGLINTARLYLSLILAGAPEIVINHPVPYQQFHVGDMIEINGTASDNGHITELTISFSGENPIEITGNYDNGYWWYFWDTKNRDAGFIEIKVSAEDDDTNVASLSIIIELLEAPEPPDTKAPEVSILYPLPDTIISQGETVRITGYAYDDRELDRAYLIFSYDQSEIDMEVTEEGEWDYDWHTNAVPAPMEVLIIINGVDAAGNIGSYNVTVIVEPPPPPADHEPPKVVIITPLEDARLSAGSTIAIIGTANDNVGIETLMLSYDDDESWLDISNKLAGSDWQYSIDTDTLDLTPNLYEIIIRAEDQYGNIGEESINIYLIDDTPPDLELVSPDSGQIFEHNAVIEITGVATDNFKVKSIEMKVNDARRWKDYTRNFDTDSGVWTITLNAKELPSGLNEIMIKATDIYGNENEIQLMLSIKSTPDSEPDKDTVESSLDFLISNRAGNFVCLSFFIVAIVIMFALIRSGRRRD